MSNTKREGHWKNKIEAPFTKPTSLLNPGPGEYNLEPKKDDIKSKILKEEATHVPFNTGSERECNKTTSKSLLPGPGAYIDINNP